MTDVLCFRATAQRLLDRISEQHRGATMDPRDRFARAGLCECGHPVADHVMSGWGPNSVCVEALDTFPEGGLHGVCPCVRHD